MLATLSDRRDFGDDWLLERKFDGERCVACKTGSEVLLESRSGTNLTDRYPEVRTAVSAQRAGRLLLDGEIVAFDGEQTSFGRLQQRLGVRAPTADLVSAYPVVYCVFDLLELDGEDLTGRPLLERRARLERAIRLREGLQLSDASRGDAERRFAEACRSGWEGLIAKRADAPYARGRSRDWLKLKCAWEQELVIGGYTDPRGSRIEFGALLVGYYEDGELRFGGKVGTGFNERELARLTGLLRPLEKTAPTVTDAKGLTMKGVHWVRPELVAQVGFSEWTPDGKLRHPRYTGLRDDKRPKQVVRERA